jgi:hypothetical protein
MELGSAFPPVADITLACDTLVMSRVCLAALLLACSCTHRSAATQDQVNALVRGCGLAGKIEFRWLGTDKLTITRVDPNADPRKFMCVSRGLEARGLRLGFEQREQLN